MFKRILILLLIGLPSILSAQNYVNEFPIYVYGDVRPIAAVFNAIAFVTAHDIYKTAIWFGVIASMVGISWVVMYRQDIGGGVKSFVFTVGAVSILLVPVDVHIVDKRMDKGLLSPNYFSVSLGYEKVSNVPYLVAIAPSLATTVSNDMIELIDDAFQGNTISYAGMEDIGKVGYASLGFGGAIENLNKIINNFNFDELGIEDASNFEKDFKLYLENCVLTRSTSDTTVKSKLIAPTQDIFSALSPTELGLDARYSLIDRNGDELLCSTFYNVQIAAILPTLVPATNAKLSQLLNVPNVTSLTGLDKIALADLQSTIFSTTTEQLAMYSYNAASAPLIEKTLEAYYRGTSVSGQDVANSITAAKSTIKLQTEGLGQFKWMVTILPYAMHFLFSVILASSILALVVLLARGLNGGMAVAKNYILGFVQFEGIRISMALVNNLVLYYSVIGAADKLTEFGGNPLAVTRIPGYLDYIATMEGVMGVLGLSSIFIIPAIILKGDISAATSALQGLGNRYAGNDLDTARDAVSKSSARGKALGNMMNDEQAMEKLSKLGLGLPANRTPLEYYNAVTNDLAGMSKGIGNTLSQDKMDDFSKGTSKQTVQGVSQTAGFGSAANMKSVDTVGFQDGAVQGHTVNKTDDLRSKTGWDASKVGRGNALNSLAKDFGAMGVDRAVSDPELDQWEKGNKNKARLDANKTLGIGRRDISEDDMFAVQMSGKAGFDSEIGKGYGAMKNYEKFGDDAYKKTSEYGERSNMGKTMAKLDAQGSIDNAVNYDAKDAMIKAHQQVGSVDGAISTYDKVKNAGEKIGEAMERVANELSSAKIASDVKAIEVANSSYTGRDGLSSYATQAADASAIKTSQAIGQVKGLNNIVNNPEKLQSFVDKGLNAVLNDMGQEKYNDVKNDMINAGLINKNGKVQSQNWVEGKSFLNANNLNSHNALVAGGVVMSGALGKEASVQVNSLNSSSSGDKKDTYEDKETKHIGKDIDYNPIIDTVGNDTMGEIVKGIISGAGFLGALDMVSGGKVRKTFGATKDKLGKAKDKFTGHTRGKGDDGKEKKFNPKNTTDVEEYLDNNAGAKSRVDYDLSGREPSGPKKPQSAETIIPTTNNTTAPNIADDMTSPLNDMNNYNTKNNGMGIKAQPHPHISNMKTEAELRTVGGMPNNPNVRTNSVMGNVMGRINGAGDALMGGGSWKTKLGLAASAMILGSQNEMWANAFNAIPTPDSLIMGQDLGAGSDIVPTNATPQNYNVWGNGGFESTFAQALRSQEVKTEFANMNNEMNNGLNFKSATMAEQEMTRSIDDLTTRVARGSNLEEMNEMFTANEKAMEDMQKAMKKVRRKQQ